MIFSEIDVLFLHPDWLSRFAKPEGKQAASNDQRCDGWGEFMGKRMGSADFDVTCPFCKIVEGAEPGWIVFEDDISIAFLDRRPLFPGHSLLIPRAHVEAFDDLPPELLGPLFSNAQLLSRAVEKGLGAEGSFIAVNNRVSQSVAHLHIHVVPRNKKDGLKGFFWPRHPYQNPDEAVHVRKKLIAAIKQFQDDESTAVNE